MQTRYCIVGIELQQHSFEEHIRIAKENDIALMIHDRDAHDDVIKTLKRVGAPEKVIFHCYSGDTDLAKVCNENGWYMSFAGNITIKRNQHLRDSLKLARRELILIETDAPYLAPVPYRGKSNHPAWVKYVCEAIASLRGISVAEVAEATTANFYGNANYYLYDESTGYITSASTLSTSYTFNGLSASTYFVVADDGGGYR